MFLFFPLILVDVSKRLLHDLYCGDRTLDGLEFKWNTLGWIMSFSKDDISKINRLPWQLRLIVATLHALVKVLKFFLFFALFSFPFILKISNLFY